MNSKLLKSDVFGRVTLSPAAGEPAILRDLVGARWWARGLGRRLMAREARALAALDGVEGVPRLLRAGRDSLVRSYIEGLPMHRARPNEPAYFRRASALLRRMHRAGVVHNDLAKEPNWLVTAAREPAIIDFQLAWHAPRRGRLFRLLAREDLRHLLKHKRTYCAPCLTRRERVILDTPSLPARAWMATVKPAYLFVTRRVLGWADREGAGDR
ncbi:MAG TPA: RIO1 family regulatory kinase/ATPase [Woeseiaceae bacterium]|nr:RIO1 family regulatory kinase/ATPase [Woeseiaceae bacterium]